MAKTRAERTRWVSHLRVSTVAQAEKELSLTAQRHSAEEFAARHHAVAPRARRGPCSRLGTRGRGRPR